MDYINIHELAILITTSAAPAMATDTPVTNTKKNLNCYISQCNKSND